MVERAPRLGALSDSGPRARRNNLNLLRLIAAFAVLVPISSGPQAAQPLERLTGRSQDALAVSVFFVLLVFLIAAS